MRSCLYAGFADRAGMVRGVAWPLIKGHLVVFFVRDIPYVLKSVDSEQKHLGMALFYENREQSVKQRGSVSQMGADELGGGGIPLTRFFF